MRELTWANADFAWNDTLMKWNDDLIHTGTDQITILGYQGTSPNVVIPSTIEGAPVTKIENWAFEDIDLIESITIPNTVKSIGDYAFCNCTSLSTVTFNPGSKLSNIGDWVFNNCTSLNNITITSVNAGLSIGNNTFFDRVIKFIPEETRGYTFTLTPCGNSLANSSDGKEINANIELYADASLSSLIAEDSLQVTATLTAETTYYVKYTEKEEI